MEVGAELGGMCPSHLDDDAHQRVPGQDCTICMERLVTSSGYEGVLSHRGIKPELVGKLGKCGHMYHLLCLLAMYNNGNKVSQGPQLGRPPCRWLLGRWVPSVMPARVPAQDGSLQCPTCKAIYGEKTGTQPPGKMEFHLIPHSLPGYTDSKTIRIVYDIPTGIQVSSLHPLPLGHPCQAGCPQPVPPTQLIAVPLRARSTPIPARSSRHVASHGTATCPTTRRAGRWVLPAAPGWGGEG